MPGGGTLVVEYGRGRTGKQYALAAGAATLGQHIKCDIRVMRPAVRDHHATLFVRAVRTVVRNESDGTTLVNGLPVSMSALRHGDVVSLGGRHFRWLYDRPDRGTRGTAQHPPPLLHVRHRAPRAPRRATVAAPSPARRLALPHRHSMPGDAGGSAGGSAGGKQVAVVQPQRREQHDHTAASTSRSLTPRVPAKRAPTLSPAPSPAPTPTPAPTPPPARRSANRLSPKAIALHATTKASQWIESRKSSPRKTAANKSYVAPSSVAPAPAPARASAPAAARKRTPLRLAVLRKAQSRVTKIQAPLTIDHTKQAAIMLMTGHTAKARSPASAPRLLVSGAARRHASAAAAGDYRRSKRFGHSVSVLEITDSDVHSLRVSTSRSTPAPPPPRSALKGSRSIRKTESIKFDLSNLENQSDFTESLHYDTSQSPSPRRSIHSRSRSADTSDTLVDPTLRKSLRRSASQITLEPSRNSKADRTWDTTVEKQSPRPSRKLESYSIVDLVSIDSNETQEGSVYDSVGSTRSSSILFGTPRSGGRSTRSTIGSNFLGSSTPFTKSKSPRSNSSPNIRKSPKPKTTRRSKSLTTPENTQKQSMGTRISRASRSRSRLNDSDLQYISSRLDDDDSPISSKRISANKSQSPKTPSNQSQRKSSRKNLTVDISMTSQNDGTVTPENESNLEEAGTPVLSIQSLLNSSQSSLASRGSRPGPMNKRKTIGGIRSKPKGRSSLKSKSLNLPNRKSLRSFRLSKESSLNSDRTKPDNEDNITPKSAVKLMPEAVKNKHSTAKKPQSKRTLIDELNDSDIIKKLFNSPVKRKLSQSMTEFSRKKLFDDVSPRRPTRNTVALTGRTPDNSFVDLDQTQFSPERFVSPLSTPGNSPNLAGIKRLFDKNTPANDLRDVRGVKRLLRTPRTVKNDLTKVSGVKKVFARSPKNRLSNVRVKEVFTKGPRNDLRRVSGVKALFQPTAKNDLTDVRGVKGLFKRKSVANDLRNVSGVKRTLRGSPKNDLRDVRGVKQLFRQEKQNDYDVSGIEELFNVSNTSDRNPDRVFDRLVGKPSVKSVYSKSYIAKRGKKQNSRKTKSLQIDDITNNVEKWLEDELFKCLYKASEAANQSKSRKSVKKTPNNLDRSANITRELQKLATDTVDGSAPIIASRIRDSTHVEVSGRKTSDLYSAHTLPFKKRSLVERSLEKSRSERSRVLPIKKRAVTHSTPLKGRRNAALNASELGRVSPITAVDKTRNLDTSIGSPAKQTTRSPKARGKAAKASIVAQVVATSPKASPKAHAQLNITSPKQTKRTTRSKKIDTEPTKKSPAKRGTRATKTSKKEEEEVKEETATKSRRTRNAEKKEFVPITARPRRTRNEKQSPVKPKGKAKATNVDAIDKENVSPKKTRSKAKTSIVQGKNRGNNDVVAPRTKKNRLSLVITKKPPVTSPVSRSRRTQKAQISLESPIKAVSTRQKAQMAEKPKTPKNTRAKVSKNTVVISKPSPMIKAKSKAKTSIVQGKNRGNNDVVPTRTKKNRLSLVITKKPPVTSPVSRSRRTQKAQISLESPIKAVSTRQKAQMAEKPKTPKNTRAKVSKNSVVISKPSPMIKAKAKTETKRTRANKTNKIESPKKPKSPVVERSRRPRNTKAEPTKETRGKIQETVEPTVSQSGRKRKMPMKAVSPKVSRSGERRGRSKAASDTAPETKTVRGRKGAAAAAAAAEPSAPAPARKRKQIASPHTEPAKKARSARGAARTPASPKAGPSRTPASPKAGPSRTPASPKAGPSRTPASPKAGPSRTPASPKAGPSRTRRTRAQADAATLSAPSRSRRR